MSIFFSLKLLFSQSHWNTNPLWFSVDNNHIRFGTDWLFSLKKMLISWSAQLSVERTVECSLELPDLISFILCKERERERESGRKLISRLDMKIAWLQPVTSCFHLYYDPINFEHGCSKLMVWLRQPPETSWKQFVNIHQKVISA